MALCVCCQDSGGIVTMTKTIRRPRKSICSGIIWETEEERLWALYLS